MNFFKEIYKYFFPDREISYFEKLKTSFFIITLFVATFLVIIMLISNILAPNVNSSVSILSQSIAISFFIITLFLIKYFGQVKAGNIFTFALLILTSFFLTVINHDIQALYKFVQGFYTIIVVIVGSVLFASRKYVIVFLVIVLIGSFRPFLHAQRHLPEFADITKVGYIQYFISLIIISIVVYFASKFSEDAIKKVEHENKLNKRKNIQLNQMLLVISQTSKELENLAKTISKSTVKLSENTNEHASSIEELSATVEQLSQSIASNVEFAQNTALSVRRTAALSESSKNVIFNTLKSVEEVNSQVSIIQEIANKTGLLSINASIEAARAGESGKGFSVVAQEVKKLAEKSETGAKEISHLINSTISISRDASENYNKIANDINYIDNSIEHISAINVEQKLGVEQINNALIMLSANSQSNATLAYDLNELLVQIKKNVDKLEKQLKIGTKA